MIKVHIFISQALHQWSTIVDYWRTFVIILEAFKHPTSSSKMILRIPFLRKDYHGNLSTKTQERLDQCSTKKNPFYLTNTQGIPKLRSTAKITFSVAEFPKWQTRLSSIWNQCVSGWLFYSVSRLANQIFRFFRCKLPNTTRADVRT